MTREVGSYDEDNIGPARFEGDDLELPESPIYSNFSKNLWRAHTQHGLAQSPDRSRESTSGHIQTPDECDPTKNVSRKAGSEGRRQ